jgi:threonine/homoserine/homoserine lactone efflux protein
MWGAVISSVVLIAAGGLVWWLWGGCWLSLTGAIGTVVGGALSIVPLFVVPDQDVALRVSFIVTLVTVVWLLGWVLASGVRAGRLAREQAALVAEATAPAPRSLVPNA